MMVSVDHRTAHDWLCLAQVPLASIDEVVNFAVEGCRQVYDVMRDAVQCRVSWLESGGCLNGSAGCGVGVGISGYGGGHRKGGGI